MLQAQLLITRLLRIKLNQVLALTERLYISSAIPELEYPSCLHTTAASALLQKSLHTVPHTPLWHISTRPSKELVPPESLTSPAVQLSTIFITSVNCPDVLIACENIHNGTVTFLHCYSW